MAGLRQAAEQGAARDLLGSFSSGPSYTPKIISDLILHVSRVWQLTVPREEEEEDKNKDYNDKKVFVAEEFDAIPISKTCIRY